MNEIIRMSGIEDYSVVNAKGITQVLFCCICYHDCAGCHNPQSHYYKNGYNVTVGDLYNKVVANKNKNVTFSGGDPMFQAKAFTKLAQLIKNNTDKTIWCYTGFTYKEIMNGDNKDRVELLKLCDVLVDGKFEEDKKDLSLKFRGSSNQRILDIPKSLSQNKPVLYDI